MSEPVAMWDQWQALLKEPEPDPLEVLRMAAAFSRYFNAIQFETALHASKMGRTDEEIEAALGLKPGSAGMAFIQMARSNRS